MARTPFVKAPITTPMADKAGSLTNAWVQWFKQKYFGGQPQYLEGIHSERAVVDPESVAEGSTYFETDRQVWYVARGIFWNYFSGIMNCTQATLAAGLGAHDVGFLAQVTDYGHLLQWTGASWAWGPAEAGSGYIQGFLGSPGVAGWHLCDGATVNRLNPAGSLTPVVLPDYTTAAYVKFGITAGPGPNAPSGDSEAVSAGTPAGTVTQTTPVTSGDASATGAAFIGAGATLANEHHTHDVAVDQHPSFAGAALATHDHGPGTLELRNTQLQAWYRQ